VEPDIDKDWVTVLGSSGKTTDLTSSVTNIRPPQVEVEKAAEISKNTKPDETTAALSKEPQGTVPSAQRQPQTPAFNPATAIMKKAAFATPVKPATAALKPSATLITGTSKPAQPQSQLPAQTQPQPSPQSKPPAVTPVTKPILQLQPEAQSQPKGSTTADTTDLQTLMMDFNSIRGDLKKSGSMPQILPQPQSAGHTRTTSSGNVAPLTRSSSSHLPAPGEPKPAVSQPRAAAVQASQPLLRSVSSSEDLSFSPNVTPTAASEFVPYEQLKSRKNTKGLNMNALEIYLSDEEFVKVMGETRDNFYNLPGWKQTEKKRKAALF